jgi:photosystem II stability/assembly factor-like uncharacterized protein
VDVAIAPTDPETVYVINYGGLWRTTNGGQTWRRMSRSEGLTSVTVHPRRAHIVFLAMRGAILRSNDGSVSWEPGPEWPAFGGGDPMQVAVDPQRPWIVYTATDPHGFYKSRDGARTWRPIAQQLGLWNAQAVILDPSNPASLYVGGFNGLSGGVHRSPDRGVTWQSVGDKGLTTTWIASLAIAADSSRIFAGTTAFGLESGGGAFWRALPSP